MKVTYRVVSLAGIALLALVGCSEYEQAAVDVAHT